MYPSFRIVAVPPCSQLGTTGPNQARLEEFHRWVGPLQNGIARVVAENLVAMQGRRA